MNNLTASPNFPAYLESVEGCILHPYLDSAKVPTIGIGSTMYDTGKKVSMADPHITRERALALAAWEAKNKGAAIAAMLAGVRLNANQFDALLSLTYNIGVGGFQSSTVLKRVKANPNDPTIAEAFMMWRFITVDGKKVESDGLINRRKSDIKLYFTPVK